MSAKSSKSKQPQDKFSFKQKIKTLRTNVCFSDKNQREITKKKLRARFKCDQNKRNIFYNYMD